MNTYTVTAKRWERGWELHIEGVGVTQSRTLARAEAMVREYISLKYDVGEDSFGVEIVPELPNGVLTEAREAQRETREAEAAQLRAAKRARTAAKRLKAAGLSNADAAAVLKVKPARISQLVNSR